MNDDADRRLAQLLRHGPTVPTVLSAEHRATILAESRRVWFRNQATQRRWWLTTAIAATLVAGVAGWTLRVASESENATSPSPMQQPLATRQQPPHAAAPLKPSSTDERHDTLAATTTSAQPARTEPESIAKSFAAPRAANRENKDNEAAVRRFGGTTPPPTAKTAAVADPMPSDAGSVGTVASSFGPPAESVALSDAHRTKEVRPPSAPPPAPMALEKRRSETDAAASSVESADVRPESAQLRPITIPADATSRPHLLAAAAILQAVRSHSLAPQDRQPALRVALELLAENRDPTAMELRRQITALLPTR